MLVLSRKVGQELTIGDNIRITVNRVCGNRVSLGIVAPKSTRVLRGELEPFSLAFEVEIEADPNTSTSTQTGLDWLADGEANLEVMARQTH